MSTKMTVRYGKDAGSITDCPVIDRVVQFLVRAKDKLLGQRAFDLDELSAEQQHRIALYGLNKLLTDRTSSQADKERKLDEMDDVFAMLVQGEWAKERQVGAPIVGAEVEALSKIMELTIPETQEALAAYDKPERAKILANPRVVEIAAEIRQARKARTPRSLDEMIS